jgi:hypothetical protein
MGYSDLFPPPKELKEYFFKAKTEEDRTEAWNAVDRARQRALDEPAELALRKKIAEALRWAADAASDTQEVRDEIVEILKRLDTKLGKLSPADNEGQGLAIVLRGVGQEFVRYLERQPRLGRGRRKTGYKDAVENICILIGDYDDAHAILRGAGLVAGRRPSRA